MKTTLPFLLTLAAAGALPPAAARAQLPVTDAMANSQLVQQVAQAVQTVRQLEAQYQQLRATYQALAHTNSVGGLAGQLGGLANTLPGAGAVQGLLGGGAGGDLASTLLGQNRAFAPGGGDWGAAEMLRRARATANVQALALGQMGATEARIAGLRQLMAELDGQPDLQAVSALNGRIAAEGTVLAAQQQQLLQLQILQRSQEQVDLQRAEERQRQSAEQWRDSLAPLE